MNNYCMFKGSLVNAAPFLARYGGKPHYVITVAAPGRETFKIVVNAASDQTGVDGNHDVYSYVDLHFVDPVTDKLAGMKPGLYQKDFPRLDYFQDRSLLDLHRMRPIPYADVDGNRADVNDILNDALSIDASGQPESLPYDDGSGNPKDRDFYLPKANDVAATVYGFGFLFPQEDGLHETHMNQGNPKNPRRQNRCHVV